MNTRSCLLALCIGSLTPCLGTAQSQWLELRPSQRRDAPREFSHIHAAALQGSQQIIVIDDIDNVVVSVDLVSGVQAVLGRQGSGPGEYRVPLALFRGPSERMRILDGQGNRVLNVINGRLDGEAITVDQVPAARLGLLWGVDQTGRFYYRGRIAGDPDSAFVVTWRPGESQTDTVGKVPHDRIRPEDVRGSGVGAGQIASGGPFAAQRVASVSPSGTVFVLEPVPYRVRVRVQGGTFTAGPIILDPPVRVTTEEVAAIRRERGPIPADQFPEVKPPFLDRGSVINGLDDRLYVNRSRPFNGTETIVDVFDRRGLRVQRLRLPGTERLIATDGKVFVVSAVDPESGIERLAWYEGRQ